jgi:hypothetical protein
MVARGRETRTRTICHPANPVSIFARLWVAIGASVTPTARCLKEARELGLTAQVVEKWIPQRRIRIDLFGVIDIIAVKQGIGIIGIQATSGTNHAARRSKALAEPRLREWLLSGGRYELWSYSKRGERGKRKLWTLRREEITAEQMEAA